MAMTWSAPLNIGSRCASIAAMWSVEIQFNEVSVGPRPRAPALPAWAAIRLAWVSRTALPAPVDPEVSMRRVRSPGSGVWVKAGSGSAWLSSSTVTVRRPMSGRSPWVALEATTSGSSNRVRRCSSCGCHREGSAGGATGHGTRPPRTQPQKARKKDSGSPAAIRTRSPGAAPWPRSPRVIRRALSRSSA
ncbi:hypothetical protein SMD44_08723 [Streptomyces alboflavus]|uniref:Uncharacterized protein n=1 Tax=Streptomyces alboflavus TaxID=67267 RepID=A0A1Z1WS25_9ACTN|nr:hypothetical protein SMD44_08723 [Streptomyces alboflavus]